MFRPSDLDTTNESFLRESGAAFEHVVRGVRGAQRSGWHAHRETRVLAGSTWAAVHGIATLWSQGAFLGAIHAQEGPACSAGAGSEPSLDGPSLEEAIATTLELVLGGVPEVGMEAGDD